jgi:hypothetical protein
MKKLISLTFAIAMMLFMSNAYSQQLNDLPSHNLSKNDVSKTKSYGYWEVTPMGGLMFPIGDFSNNFEISAKTGMDITYRVNREVGIYGNVSYNMLSAKTTEGPSASYLSYTAGPRYYFTNPKLKSTLFVEAGIGGYTFTQDAYQQTVEGVTTNFPEQGDTRVGFNAGVGGDVFLSDHLSLMMKAKYNTILGSGDDNTTRSFLGVDGGLNIRF